MCARELQIYFYAVRQEEKKKKKIPLQLFERQRSSHIWLKDSTVIDLH